MIAVAASVAAASALVGAVIAVTAAFLQSLRRWRWHIDCSDSVGAAITAIACDCGHGGVGAVIALAVLVAAAAALVSAAFAVVALVAAAGALVGTAR